MAGVKDRLVELQAMQGKPDKNEKKQKTKKTTTANSMDALQEQVRGIEAKLTTVKRNVKEMETMQKNILSSPFCDKQEVYKYEQVVNNIQQVSTQIRTQLRQLEQEVIAEKTPKDGESALQRVKTQQLNRLTNTLASLTNDFFKAQADYMDKMKNRMRTQLEVSRGAGNITDDEVNEILQKDNYSAFTQNFISDVQDAESQLKQIEDRQKEILALEKNVFQVNQLFKDISVLVQDQGVMVDNIEANIVETHTHVESGNVELKKAKRHRTKGRKMMICVAVVVVVVIIIVVAVLATQL